ncbi:MAG: hypothetical protein JJT95_00850 [Pararhodobacter sp.]|nr:hypothetical protein [Pararhodobacter sp.]
MNEGVARGGGALPSLGAELEMVVIDGAGASGLIDDRYFLALQQLRGGSAHTRAETMDGRIVALLSAIGVNGIDNGFNLLETAHAAIPAGAGGLDRLGACMRADLQQVLEALGAQGLHLTSLAQHPTAGTGPDQYARAVAPKSVYDYLNRIRGWTHSAGIDAKSQNGPTTGVELDNCIPALNLLLAASPAFIALFANSPFEAGRRSGLMETRMTLWPRVVGSSRFPADRERVGLPPRWFDSLGDYFDWTFAPGTVMQAIPAASGSYKGRTSLFVAGDGRLNAGDFFRGGPVPGRDVQSGESQQIVPGAAHFEFLQWSNFLDFRIRFGLGQPGPSQGELAAAFADPALFERLFRNHAVNLYLENRCAGATFADADLAERAPEPAQASCMIAPSAIQVGLVVAARAHGAGFCHRWPVERVTSLRKRAMRDALSGNDSELRDFCAEVLELARSHLPETDRRHLAYAEWVLDTGLTGAQRTLDHRAGLRSYGHGVNGLERLARARAVLLPPSGDD